MHLTLLVLSLTVAWAARWLPTASTNWQGRWQRALPVFLFSPLLLLMTAIALVVMGPQGQMVCWWEGWLSYYLAVGFLVYAGFLAVQLAVQGWRSLCQIRTYPTLELNNQAARLLPTTIPFIAQIGFWQTELVVSEGLLTSVDAAHLAAVLTHEQAHRCYRDTFWFFWWGWLRRLTAWLPQTDYLWQELLLLREQRADQWAAQQVDPLLLAESLWQLASAPALYENTVCAAFNSTTSITRLEERINALLEAPTSPAPAPLLLWVGLLLAILPLAIVPFHY